MGEKNISLLEPPVLRPKQWIEPQRGRTVETDTRSPNFRVYWKFIQKRYWTIGSVLALVFTVVLIATVKQAPIYEAKALVEIEPTNPNIISVQELFQLSNVTDNYLETQYKILESDSLARDVIQQLHLDQVREFNTGKPASETEQDGSVRTGGSDPALPTDAKNEETVLRRFEERLSVSPVQRSSLVRVSFDSQDPQLAAKAVNALAENYIEENLETHWQATQKASTWLNGQLAGLKVKLEKSEDDLQSYARANGLLYLENDKGQTENIVDERLRQLQEELTQSQADRYQKEAVYKLAEGGDYGALQGVFDNKLTQDLSDRISELERQKAALAPSFKPDYPKMKDIQSQINRSKQLLDQERAEAARHIADEYFAAVRREVLVNDAFVSQQKQANVVAEKSVQYNILKREADTNKQLYEGLLERLKEAGVSAGLKASNVRIVDAAVPPTSAVRPRVALNLVMGLLLGLVGGVALAFVQERVDNTLKSFQDLETFLQLPTLGIIPSSVRMMRRKNGIGRWIPEPKIENNVGGTPTVFDEEENGRWIRVDARALRDSDLCEAFRGLRTSVLLSTAGRPPRSVVFLSAEASEGKTTVCCNLAISLAQLGKRVLVVDGDMRCPGVSDFFHIRGAAGLANYLAGEEDWRKFVQPSGSRDLDCLICGCEPPNPSDLLSSERTRALVDEAMNEYDFVLVDSPPLLGVTDGRILAATVDAAVLVIKGGATSRELVQRAQMCVADVGAHLIGAVLNNLDRKNDGCQYTARDGARFRNGRGRADAPSAHALG